MSLSKSYIHTPLNQSYPYFTIPERIQALARQKPDKPAFVIVTKTFERTMITRNELYEKSKSFAKGLKEHGVQKGDVVAVSLQNTLEWLVCTFGTMAAGAIPAFFHFNKIHGEDIIDTLNSLKRCSAIVFRPGNDDINWKIFEKIVKLEKEKGKVSSAIIPALHLVVCDKLPSISSHPFTVDEIVNTGCASEATLPQTDSDDICVIFLTSGSTGVPKAVHKTHVSVLMSGVHSTVYGHTESDIYYSDSLFIWVGGFAYIYLIFGSIRVTTPYIRDFSTITERTAFAVKCIESEACTCALFFPYCLTAISEEIFPCKQWPLKFVASGGLPVPIVCAEVGCKIAKKFINVYGSTEISDIAFKLVNDPSQYQSSMIGKPFPGIEIKIVDNNGFVVPINTTGEILVRPCSRFLGYLNNQEKTYTILSTSGWCHTDDIGLINGNNDIIFLGRKSEVMIIAGAVLHPALTEEKIKRHPDVEDVCVVPIEDERLYQQQCACVVPRSGKSLDKEEIIDFIRMEVASLSNPEYGVDIPRYFVFLDSLPRTPVGKIFRKGLIDLANSKLQHN